MYAREKLSQRRVVLLGPTIDSRALLPRPPVHLPAKPSFCFTNCAKGDRRQLREGWHAEPSAGGTQCAIKRAHQGAVCADGLTARDKDLDVLRLQLGRRVRGPAPSREQRPSCLWSSAHVVFLKLLARKETEQHLTTTSRETGFLFFDFAKGHSATRG